MVKIKRNSWIVIDHPAHFLPACNLSIYLAKKCGYKSKLLITRHEYWKHFKIRRFRHFFSDIYWFDRYDYPPPLMNSVKQFLVSIFLIPQLLFLKIKIMSLNFGNDDLIFGLSNGTFLESMIIGNTNVFKKIAVLQYTDYDSLLNKPREKKYGSNLAIDFVQVLRKLYRMKETVFIYNKNVKEFSDGDYYLGYKEKINDVFDELVLFAGNYGKFYKTFHDKNIYLTKYPDMLQNMRLREKTKTIVFLGGDIIRGMGVGLRTSVKEINKYLRYIRLNYGEKYNLLYKPHPREEIDSKELDLTDFKIVSNKEPAEVFLSENRKNIQAVFSVVSSASQFAYYIGINSYLFFKLFPFDNIRQKSNMSKFSAIAPECFITSLKVLPRSIKKVNNRKVGSFEMVIEKIIKK